MRTCFACESTTSYRDFWYVNRDKYNEPINHLCFWCYSNILRRPKRFQSKEERNKWFAENNKGQIPPNKGKRMFPDRKCDKCKSKTTYIDKKGIAHWRNIIDENGNKVKVFCENCYAREIGNKSDYKKRYNKERLHYKGKDINLGYNPRTGFCSICGTVGYTQLHHEKYDDSDPLAHTQERCQSCHSKRTWELKQLTPEKFLKVNRKHNNN